MMREPNPYRMRAPDIPWPVLNRLIDDLYAQRDAAEADAARLGEALHVAVGFLRRRAWGEEADRLAEVLNAALAAHRERVGGDG